MLQRALPSLISSPSFRGLAGRFLSGGTFLLRHAVFLAFLSTFLPFANAVSQENKTSEGSEGATISQESGLKPIPRSNRVPSSNDGPQGEVTSKSNTTDPALKTKTGAKKQDAAQSEYWVGWIDTPDRQLRWVVEFKTIELDGNATLTANSWNPDLLAKPLPMNRVSVEGQYWRLEWTEAGSKDPIKYEAIQETADKATGFLIVGEQSIPVVLNKVANLPEENARTLGGDIVWLDQLPPTPNAPTPKRFDIRLRFYTEGPFAAQEPRIVLDSINSKLLGVPVELEQSEGDSLIFQIPSIKATYSAILKDADDQMNGTFSRNGQQSELTLYLFKELVDPRTETAEVPPPAPKIAQSKQGTDSDKPREMPEQFDAPKQENKEQVRIEIQSPRKSNLPRELADNESAFLLDIPDPTTRTKAKSESKDNSVLPSIPRTLGGTITYPSNKDATSSTAVIMLSTFDLTDRDGTVGVTKFYRDLAQWFAKNNVISVRLDDRGIGESLPIESMTSEDRVRDINAIIEMLMEDPRVAQERIGIFGHGEGAGAAMKVASGDPRIAFTILFGPPGMNGQDLSYSRLMMAAQQQGLTREDANKIARFQSELQRIALTTNGDKVSQVQMIRKLVSDQWASVGKLMSGIEITDPNERSKLEADLLQQVSSYEAPIVRDSLESNPATDWMLGNAPTLAIFGGRDQIIDRNTNLEPLQQAALRNNESRFTFVDIPTANHWFSDSVASDDEVASKPLTIAPQFLSTVENWMRERGL